MRRSRLGTWLILGALLFVMIVAFSSIMEKRFSSGDIYSHYSSKRSDPLGARAFYESLERLPGIEAQRNFDSLQRIKSLDEDTTLMLLGLPRINLTELRATDDSPVLDAVRNGTRLVIVMNPGFVPMSYNENEDDKNWFERREELKEKRRQKNSKKDEGRDSEKEGGDDEGESEEDEGSDSESDEDEAPGEPLLEHLAIDIMVPETFERPDDGWAVKLAPVYKSKGNKKVSLTPPQNFPNWHSQFRFEKMGKLWTNVALVDDLPVVVERVYGKGKIIMASDVYFVSNEALWKGGDTSFLWWLIGGKKKVVIDETIHGSVESGGIMKLILRYRLHGFFAGLFIFIALLAWSSGSSLVPGSEEMERGLISGGATVLGEDSSSGLVSLLRRSIRPTDVLDKCVKIWEEGTGRGVGTVESLSAEQKSEMDRLLATRRRHPKQLPLAEAYEKLVRVLYGK